MFKLFEGFTDPFPKGEPQRPPNTLWAFVATTLAGLKTIDRDGVTQHGDRDYRGLCLALWANWWTGFPQARQTHFNRKPDHFDLVRLIGIGRYAAFDRLLFTTDSSIFAR